MSFPPGAKYALYTGVLGGGLAAIPQLADRTFCNELPAECRLGVDLGTWTKDLPHTHGDAPDPSPANVATTTMVSGSSTLTYSMGSTFFGNTAVQLAAGSPPGSFGRISGMEVTRHPPGAIVNVVADLPPGPWFTARNTS